MLGRIARLCHSHPWPILAVALVLVITAGALGKNVEQKLAPAFYEPTSSAESIQADERLFSALGYEADATVLVLAESPEDFRTDRGAQRELNRLTRVIEREPLVGHVATYLNGGGRFLLSPDGKRALITVHSKERSADAVRDQAALLRDNLTSERLDLFVGGYGGTWVEGSEVVRNDLKRIELAVFPILFLLLIFVFRSLVAALLPLSIGAVCVLGASYGLQVINETTPISLTALNIVTVLGLGLAVDYSLLLVNRYREEVAKHGVGQKALEQTLTSAGRTVVYSAVVVSLSMAALLVFPQPIVNSIGVGGAFVAILACVSALVVLPALLSLLGDRVNRLRPGKKAIQPQSAWWANLATKVMRHPGRVAVASALVLVALGTPFLKAHFSHPDASDLPEGSDALRVHNSVQRDFMAGFDVPLNVVVFANGKDGRNREIQRLRSQIAEAAPGQRVLPPVPIGSDTTLISVLSYGPLETEQASALIARLRSLDTPLVVAVGGPRAEFQDLKIEITDRLPLAVGIIALTTFFTLLLMTRSLLLPIKSLIMNALTLTATFGFLVLLFGSGDYQGILDRDGPGSIDLLISVVLFALIFGLVTDYTVFLLSRIKEEYTNTGSNELAIVRGMQSTGRLLTSAAAILAIAVGSLILSSQDIMQAAGLGVAFAVAVDATIVRGLLVPSLMKLMGKWNWWLPGKGP